MIVYKCLTGSHVHSSCKHAFKLLIKQSK